MVQPPRTVYGEDTVGVQLRQNYILFNKPVYLGLAVLDLSKVVMYDFFYKKLKAELHDSIRLIYTDTDSLILEFKGVDPHAFMLEHADWFDTSNYPEGHPCYSDSNNKVLGKMKDEMAGKKIQAIIALRPKLYAVRKENDEEEVKAKGVGRVAIRKRIKFENLLECLKEEKTMSTWFHRIASKRHIVETVKQTKIALSYNDDKRVPHPSILYDTVPYGSKLLILDEDKHMMT